MKKITNPALLIDADMLLYRIASGLQRDTDWGDDIVSVTLDLRAAKSVLKEEMDRLLGIFDTTLYKLCFSDPNNNFRKQVFEGYKSGRGRKPVGYRLLVEHCFKNYECLCMPGLEADDVMGIMMTDRNQQNGIIVSSDKDMLTIPGRHFKLYGDVGWEDVRVVDAKEAHYNHMMQTLCGDSTDGYPGCRGIGKVTAAKILLGEQGNLWTVVLDTFLQKGFDEDFALQQARLARILHASDVSEANNGVILWEPEDADWIPTDLVLS